MRLISLLAFWAYTASTFILCLFLFYKFIPEEWLYDRFSDKYGLIYLDEWTEFFGYFSFFICFLANCLVIWISVFIYKKIKKA